MLYHQALYMFVTAAVGLYAWYQAAGRIYESRSSTEDMNITYICLWGLVSAFLGVMAAWFSA